MMQITISNKSSTMTKEFPASDAEYEAWCCRLIEGERAYLDGVRDLFIKNMAESMDKVREEVLGVVFPRGFANRNDFTPVNWDDYVAGHLLHPNDRGYEGDKMAIRDFDPWENIFKPWGIWEATRNPHPLGEAMKPDEMWKIGKKFETQDDRCFGIGSNPNWVREMKVILDKKKEVKNMKTDRIIVIMDRSGSMDAIRDDSIGGFNAFLSEQKKVGDNATVTLVQFDDQYEVVYDNKPIRDVEYLTRDTFHPRGSTSLLDAIGKTINTVNARQCCNCCGKNIYVIITDGQENTSKEFTRKQIFDKITHAKEAHNSEFIFLAANQDAIAEGGSIGISWNYCNTYAATGQGVRDTYWVSSKMVSDLRTNGTDDNE